MDRETSHPFGKVQKLWDELLVWRALAEPRRRGTTFDGAPKLHQTFASSLHRVHEGEPATASTCTSHTHSAHAATGIWQFDEASPSSCPLLQTPGIDHLALIDPVEVKSPLIHLHGNRNRFGWVLHRDTVGLALTHFGPFQGRWQTYLWPLGESFSFHQIFFDLWGIQEVPLLIHVVLSETVASCTATTCMIPSVSYWHGWASTSWTVPPKGTSSSFTVCRKTRPPIYDLQIKVTRKPRNPT